MCAHCEYTGLNEITNTIHYCVQSVLPSDPVSTSCLVLSCCVTADLCKCPLLWSPLESDLAPGQPIVYLCTTPSYIEGTCSCQDLLNSTTCSVRASFGYFKQCMHVWILTVHILQSLQCSPAFDTSILSALGRVCRFRGTWNPYNQCLCVCTYIYNSLNYIAFFYSIWYTFYCIFITSIHYSAILMWRDLWWYIRW